ncbi:MAG: hypothetical protein ACI35S_02565 [Anaeroplasma sp.]
MNKLFKVLTLLMVMIISLFTLVGCNSSDDFYKEWYEAGAQIEKDNVFELITVDKAVEMKEAKESFIVFLGSSTNSTAVSEVTGIQYDADNMNYDGKLYFINTKEIISSISKMKSINEKLNIKLESSTSGLIAICYDGGVQKFETSRPNGECDRFIFDGTDSVSIRAVAVYAFEFYPVKK